MNIRIRAYIGIFFLLTFIPVAQAETPFDITSCVTGPTTVLSSSKELVILSVELKGIIMSNHENKVFDNFISHFVGVCVVVRVARGPHRSPVQPPLHLGSLLLHRASRHQTNIRRLESMRNHFIIVWAIN